MVSSHTSTTIGGVGKGAKDYTIVPSIDGSLLAHKKNKGGMRKTSVKARILAEKAPFVSNGELRR